jgi:hypothetical protein
MLDPVSVESAGLRNRQPRTRGRRWPTGCNSHGGTSPHFYLDRRSGCHSAELMRENDPEAPRLREGDAQRSPDRHLARQRFAAHPRVNATWRDGSVQHHEEINIGIAGGGHERRRC